MNWTNTINTVTPHVVRIETPSGYGTGFLAFYNENGRYCGIATAAHVVAHADEWQQPIRIRKDGVAKPRFLREEDRVIFLDNSTDSAVIFFSVGELQLPELPITLTPVGEPCAVGSDIGWLGYPAIATSLCFFAGTVSARQQDRGAYLIDGVAINGVSGGPVFHCVGPNNNEVQIIGSVSAYHANRATGEALPGLLRAQDVSHFHEAASHIRGIDEANAKKRELEEKQKQQALEQAPKANPDGVSAKR